MNRRPERLADLLPGVVADLAARHHATNGEPPMAEPPDPVYEAVELLFRHRHNLAPDVLRSLADIWSCASAARYGEPHEEFWTALAEEGFYGTHDTAECESVRMDGAA